MSQLSNVRKLLVPAGLAIVTGLVACDDGATGPGDSPGALQFDHEITVSDFQGMLDAGPTRVEVVLEFGSLTALEVEVEEPEAISHQEEIESLIIDLQTSGDQGTLTLFLGGLEVGFNADTRFRAGEDDDMTFDAFAQEVQAILTGGHEPRVEVRRDPPVEPQDPNASTFTATEIRLREDVKPKIEMNVDGDNLEMNPNPGPGEPDAWITVLGLRIDLLVSEGITQLGEEEEEYADEVDFEGHVRSVDLEAHTVTLANETIIRIAEGTEIGEADDGETLSSLEAVKEAIEAGKDVVAWGDGVVESEQPLTILAIEVTFVLVGDEEEGDSGEFEGWVESVDLEASLVTLTNGTTVRIVDDTRFADGAGKLTSLASVEEALDAGDDVLAYGHGQVESAEPYSVVAIEVAFAVHDAGSDTEEFEGRVATVNVDAGTATLGDGTVILITDETTFADGENKLTSLAAVKEALDMDEDVVAYGHGNVESLEPLTIAAIEVAFAIVTGP